MLHVSSLLMGGYADKLRYMYPRLGIQAHVTIHMLLFYSDDRFFASKADKKVRKPSPSLLRNATSPKGRGFGRPYRFLYLFGETCGIMGLRPCPPILFGREVKAMSSILSFVLSVGANVTSYYICKWLDRWFTGRKH